MRPVDNSMRVPRAKAGSYIMTKPRKKPIDKHIRTVERQVAAEDAERQDRQEAYAQREAKGKEAQRLLTPQVVEGFVGGMLQSGFDNPQPVPQFHRDLWALTCSNDKYVAIAAPRGHGKSTSVTHSYTLAALLFGTRRFGLILSATWEQSGEFLRDIKFELQTNEDIHAVFGAPVFVKDTADDMIVTIGGWTFRVVGRGSGQGNIRGIKWRGKRPDLIVGDDLEQDEQVANADRREKFRTWLFNAVLPCGSDDAHYRIVGTVMHYDSALERLLNDPSWMTARFKAHKGFDDFSEILWPGKHTPETLRAIRQRYINQGAPEGYSQEYLNEPSVAQNAYFRPDDMLPMRAEDYDATASYYAAVDLAIGQKRRNDYTVIAVGALDALGTFSIVDIRRGRWDSFGIINEILSVQQRYKPDLFGIEKGHIQLAIMPFLDAEMRRTHTYINRYDVPTIGDKPQRAKSIQAMMRAGGVRFDKEASWWPGLEDEMSKFTEAGSKSGHDDQVDALAMLGMMVADAVRPPTVEEEEEAELEMLQSLYHRTGVSKTTGY